MKREIVITPKFKLFVVCCVCIAAALSVIGLVATSTSIDPYSTLMPAAGFVLLLTLSYAYRRRDMIISEICLVATLMILVTNVCNVPMFVIGRLRPPFQDSLLVSIDQWFGLEVPRILALEGEFPLVYQVVSSCYNLLLPVILVSLLIPTALGHGRYVREFFIALLSSAVIGFTLFYLLPAEGWFDRYGITPRPDQQFYLDMIQAVWTHDTFAIDFGYRAGLVYFPSFHTVIPILCLFTLRAILPILICFVPLVVLIVLSTMTTGSHYPCDIYAGVVVALVSQIIAAKVERFVA